VTRETPKFRSNTEALWAQFFDAAGIAWEYEPIVFRSGGRRYTPDFRLGNADVFAETKWEGVANNSAYLVHNGGQFTKPFTHCPLILCNGRPDGKPIVYLYPPGEYVRFRQESFLSAYATALELLTRGS